MAALLLLDPAARAQEPPEQHLVCAGILGNSGEQGASLVLYGPKPASGLGVVYDKYGTLWDRGGSGMLNRYALDGRLVATYPIAAAEFSTDKITHIGDTIILLLDHDIETISVDAPSGTKPTPLGVNADGISFGSIGNQIAIQQGGTISLLDLTTKALTPIATEPPPPDAGGAPAHPGSSFRDFELKPDGSLVVTMIDNGHPMEHLFKGGQEVTAGWPRTSPGGRIQWIGDYWYAQFGHATIRRFNGNLEATPGVVLGGGSGSFIGHVDENDELDAGGRGLAPLNDKDTFAMSGPFGVDFILHWNQAKAQFDIVRRIGATQACRGIALNRQGDIWAGGGSWAWNDRPESPRQNGVAIAEIGQVTMLPNDTFSCACTKNGLTVIGGNFTWHVIFPDPTAIPKNIPRDLLQGSAIYRDSQKRLVLLTINNQGLAYAFQIGTNGAMNKYLGPVTLTTTPLLKKWTSLAMAGDDTLLVGADGVVAQMKRNGDNWTLDKRWNGWGDNGATSRFGPEIYLSTDETHLWVSDTQRHRVLCFPSDGGDPIASFGEVDKPGNDLSHLNVPQVIIGRGNRAIVYDSANERYVKLELKP